MTKAKFRPITGFHLIPLIISALAVLMAFTAPTAAVNAAAYLFKYKNVTTDTIVKYNYTVPHYFIDGEEIDTQDTPPIIISNTAMCSADALFGNIEGMTVKFTKSSGKLKFTYNDNTLIMYLGKTSYTLNGEKGEYDIAPFRAKYYSSGKYTNLVPTRFVAESLGMEYVWTQSASTVTIKTPIKILYNDEVDYYLGTLGKLSFNGSKVSNPKTPSYIYNDNALLCLRTISNAIPALYYDYNSKTGEITIKYSEITLKLKLGSIDTYVNGCYDVAPIAPCEIYNFDYNLNRVYIPGRYVFETLGFDYQWDSETGTSLINETEETGIYHPDFSDALFYDAVNEPVDAGYRQTLVFPFMHGIKVNQIEIQDRINENLITFSLCGNYMDFYREQEIINTGESVIQLQILYFEEEDITTVNLYTRTDDNGIILGHLDNRQEDLIVFTLDWPPELYDKIIVMDAGHGGTDPGTVYGGYQEKDLNFDIVYNYCKKLFDDSHIKVYYSRYDDTLVDLHVRPTIPARIGADFFVSVHHNALNSTSSGTCVFYSTANTGIFNGYTSRDMASLFLNNLCEDLGTKNGGYSGGRNYVVVSEENAVPAVLLEIGFMSNPEELKQLVKKSFQKKVAQSIFDTVTEIYKYPH